MKSVISGYLLVEQKKLQNENNNRSIKIKIYENNNRSNAKELIKILLIYYTQLLNQSIAYNYRMNLSRRKVFILKTFFERSD